MNTNLDTQSIVKHYQNFSEQYTKILENLSEEELNTVAFLNSWTVAEVVNHITKANDHGFLFLEGTNPERAVDERVPELKKMLLDYELKMESPDFILPDDRKFTKEESIKGIQKVFNELSLHIGNTELSELIDHDSPLGSITKWEIANFIVFHSKRHLHQIENIVNSLKKSKY